MASHQPPPLPPAFSKSKSPGRINTKPGKDDSSWITKKTNPKVEQKTLKLGAMQVMTRAFRESMRCSIEEAESKKSTADRIDCIHFGNLLVAMDLMKDCMKAHGMTRTTADLEYHSEHARLLHRATPPESRDCLSGLMAHPSEVESSQRATDDVEENIHDDDHNSSDYDDEPFVRNFPEEPTSPIRSAPPAGQTPETTLGPPFVPEPVAASTPTRTDSKWKHSDLPWVDAKDRERARTSMFWLCNFVRYFYNVHRLVLRIGHGPVDAVSMSFMRYLQPYFADYYCTTQNDDARTFLKVLEDHRKEHFFVGFDAQSLRELKRFLGVLEVVMYLWTPAFEEMALKGGEFLSR
jgi:hypothetical protein